MPGHTILRSKAVFCKTRQSMFMGRGLRPPPRDGECLGLIELQLENPPMGQNAVWSRTTHVPPNPGVGNTLEYVGCQITSRRELV
jgi:hypothetical protein